ncbi:DPP IV N-terminal domain-containing protein [Flavobacterium sp. 7A]|uniref:DPP IV N-terminal domain-containing protein n=1 Tax=Flavobacterium sp. 7A TaxID=2940571 RepID=UPI002227ACFC|nr:DPP IV N-terminal domain-containing protein [Flavobacterium sp. 7A]MCW2118676.1 dipeptidyl aminopeptidase/acylaminoacyl peptidase [Flavobacterium sp. 7A]
MSSNRFLLLLLFAVTGIFAQQKLTVETLYDGSFRPQGMAELQALKKTNQYTVLNYDEGTGSIQIDLYDFASLKKTATLFDTKSYSRLPMVQSYSFDASENLILMACNKESIYRHSFTADYYVYDIAKKQLQKVGDKAIQEPTFSPDGKKVAFVQDNNLYVYDLATKATTAITTDGKKNEIINGITDWVYEEEFAFVRAFDWSTDSKNIAFIRFDESKVPEFSMSIFGTSLYPTIEKIKYPKAGESNSVVSLHLYNVSSKSSKNVDLSQYKDFLR